MMSGEVNQNLGCAMLFLALTAANCDVLVLRRSAVRVADALSAACGGRRGRLWFSGEKPLVLRQPLAAWRLVGRNRVGCLSPGSKCGRRPELHCVGSTLLSCCNRGESIENGALAVALFAGEKRISGCGCLPTAAQPLPTGTTAVIGRTAANAESSRHARSLSQPAILRMHHSLFRPVFGDFCQPRCILSTLTYPKGPLFQIAEALTVVGDKNQRHMA